MLKKLLITTLLVLTPAVTYAQPEVASDAATTTLNEAIDATETGIDVVSSALFPATPASPSYFIITLQRLATPTTFEILRCTVNGSNTFTCGRDCGTGTCDGSGQTFSSGDLVHHSPTANSWQTAVNPAGIERAVQYNNANVRGGANWTQIDQGDLVLREHSIANGTITSTFSAAGQKVTYGPAVSGCPNMPSRFQTLANTSASEPRLYQFSPTSYNFGFIGGSGGINSSTTLGTYGALAGYTMTTCTIITNIASANTNALTRRTRVRASTGSGAGNNCEVIGFNTTIFRGNTANTGGFFWALKGFSWQAVTTTNIGFVGIHTANIANVAISTLTNIVGFAFEAGQTTLHVYTNDNSGSVTGAGDVSLGANFPVATTALYDLFLYAAPAASTIEYCVVRKDSAQTAYGTLSSDLPVNTTWLKPVLHIGNGAAATAGSNEWTALWWESANPQ